MLMPTADRRKIYEKIFEDGVAIAKKDYNLKSHPEIEGVKNLYVIKALKVSNFNSTFYWLLLPSLLFQNFFNNGYEECQKSKQRGVEIK